MKHPDLMPDTDLLITGWKDLDEEGTFWLRIVPVKLKQTDVSNLLMKIRDNLEGFRKPEDQRCIFIQQHNQAPGAVSFLFTLERLNEEMIVGCERAFRFIDWGNIPL